MLAGQHTFRANPPSLTYHHSPAEPSPKISPVGPVKRGRRERMSHKVTQSGTLWENRAPYSSHGEQGLVSHMIGSQGIQGEDPIMRQSAGV